MAAAVSVRKRVLRPIWLATVMSSVSPGRSPLPLGAMPGATDDPARVVAQVRLAIAEGDEVGEEVHVLLHLATGASSSGMS